MVIDSHLHVLRAENFDEVTEARIGHRHPQDTPIEDLVGWLVGAGIDKAVVMGQDTTRMWNSSCGEDHVLECVKRYPDLFIALAAVEAVDRSGRFKPHRPRVRRARRTGTRVQGHAPDPAIRLLRV